MAVIVDVSALPGSGTAHIFEGEDYGGVPLSFFLVETPPGKGPTLHVHPYPEVFVVQSGRARFTVGAEEIEVCGGQIVIAPAHVPHTFTNIGPDVLRQIDLHPTATMDTTWLTG